MSYIPRRRQLSLGTVMLIFIFVSCTRYSTTQQNIKKVNDVFEVKNQKISSDTIQQPVQKNVAANPGSLSLSQFLDSKTPSVLQSVNPWFSRVQDWARLYIDIAKTERDVRNYVLSEKYSTIGVMWANRAIQIKDLPTAEASARTKLWVEELQLPDLPNTSTYFVAQDTYERISATKRILQSLQHRFCLIEHGAQIIHALAYLNLSIDLFNQKKYSKALYKIQSGLASVESIAPDEDKKCGESEETESPDLK